MMKSIIWLGIVIFAALTSQGCSSFVIRNGQCEAAYTRSFTEVDGLSGTNICGASAAVDKAKVDSEGIRAATAPVGTALRAAAVGGAVEAVAPAVIPMLVK